MLNKLKSFLPVYLYFVLRLPKILFWMPLSFYGRSMIRVLCADMGLKNPADAIPQPVQSIRLDALVPAQPVDLLHPVPYHGDISTYELITLNSLVKHYQPKTLFEIGTLHGRTTVNLLANSPDGATVYTLDILEELPDNKFASHPRAKDVKRIVNDSRTLDTTPYAKKMDFVFIDANHEYDFVLNDSEKAMELVSDNGVVVWHDYTFVAETKRAINDFMARYPNKTFQHITDTTMIVMINA